MVAERPDADSVAHAVAASILERDNATNALGMRLVEIGPGRATLAMTVRDDMLNGHAICHGGFIFTLAYSCFAFACNSRNQATVAQACDISFLRPVKGGETLTASCRERHLAGRSGIYDVEVTGAGGDAVAMFRGRSRAIRGAYVPGLGGDAS